MTNTKPEIKNLLHPAEIFTDPQKAITQYYLSKKEARQIKKYPEWDKPRVCPEFEVIRARQELAFVQEKLLQEKKIEQQERRIELDKQWNEIRQQQMVFRESFIKFNKFVRENRSKRERAQHKIAEERERQGKLKEEIDDLTEKLENMKAVSDKMQSYVEEYKKYQAYLERVVEETAEFQSINDIFNRYETLVEARIALAEHQDQSLQVLEDAGTEIYNMTEAKSQMLIHLNDKLAQLQARFDKAKVTALKWETIVARIKATIAAKDLELIQIKACCWSLYQQICRRRGTPVTLNRDDIEQQLVHIKRTILQLKRIVKAARKKTAKSEKALPSS